tara:strand:+ start:217 stop:828 length:612 start_codon:yes stop_codon:yes gene_type:complete
MQGDLTQAQKELYYWLEEYIKEFHHSPSIRQMMKAMNLKSPAPIQSRLKHLQEKGWISWQGGKARTLQLINQIKNEFNIPILGSVAAGGLVETFNDFTEELDITEVFRKKNVFALSVNGDSMIDACIADRDIVLMEKLENNFSIPNGTIVSAMVPGLGTTLKYFYKKGNEIRLQAANPNYEDILLDSGQVNVQGKLLAVWRKA